MRDGPVEPGQAAWATQAQRGPDSGRQDLGVILSEEWDPVQPWTCLP